VVAKSHRRGEYQALGGKYQALGGKYQLSVVNTRLSVVNTRLSVVNTRLSAVNTKLSMVNTCKCGTGFTMRVVFWRYFYDYKSQAAYSNTLYLIFKLCSSSMTQQKRGEISAPARI
jgi:hypothetical protein